MITIFQIGSLRPKPNFDLFHSTYPFEPISFEEIIKLLEWYLIMAQKCRALQDQQTWILVPTPSNTNILGSKCIFKNKYKSDGSINIYKAHLVAL